MKRNIMLLVFFCGLLSFLQSCRKNEGQPGPLTPGDNAVNYGEMVRAIQWDNGLRASMLYDADSTLSRIRYSFRNVAGSTVIEWEGKRVKSMYEDESRNKNTYYYADGRISHFINSPRQATSAGGYKMEFDYKSNGQLAKLRYFVINEAGTNLKTETVYEYSSSGDLMKATTTGDNSIVTHTIEQYSAPVDFNPLIFIEVGLYENYTVFNLPVMTRMKKYPLRIVRTVQIGNEAAYIDKIDEHICEISNRRLNKIKSTITVPKMPQYSKSVTGVFEYD
ncbi:hypothetical protein [Ravibacter arvi]